MRNEKIIEWSQKLIQCTYPCMSMLYQSESQYEQIQLQSQLLKTTSLIKTKVLNNKFNQFEFDVRPHYSPTIHTLQIEPHLTPSSQHHSNPANFKSSQVDQSQQVCNSYKTPPPTQKNHPRFSFFLSYFFLLKNRVILVLNWVGA